MELNPPEIKGVVYNEMKGHFQSAESVFHGYIHEHVLNGTEYAHTFGGDPRHIPNLSHEELMYASPVNIQTLLPTYFRSK